MKGIKSGYKLSQLLSGAGGSADTAVNVTIVEFRFGTVVLTEKLEFVKKNQRKDWRSWVHSGVYGYTIILLVMVATE